MSKTVRKVRVLFPIGAKLVIIISILLLISLGAVIFLVSYLSTQDVQQTAESNNFSINQRDGLLAEGSFKAVETAVLLYIEMLDHNASGEDRNADLEWFFFNRNQNLAAVCIEKPAAGDTGAAAVFIPNEAFLNSNSISAADVEQYFTLLPAAVPGRMILSNAAPVFQVSLTGAVFTREGNEGGETVKVLFTPEDIAESFGTGTNTTYIINTSGDVLLHSDTDLVLGGANVSSLPIVETMREEGDSNRRQISFTDNDGIEKFGAYYRINGTDAAAITTIPHDIVFEAIQSLTRQNLFLTAGVLFLAILFIWFFSKTISRPARELADAALRIEGGDFDVALKPKTKDELGLLTESFGKMSGALNIFGRFTNKDIAVKAMRGEIKPGGLSKHATVFFSDIRDFTAKSENFTGVFGEDASNRIVMWLNEYLTRMVDCVEKTGGVVDKFIGDSVMAHWGTVYSAGSPAKDAFNCLKCALMMRAALRELNMARAKDDPGNPEIYIGCGINTGIVTAGQIGSEQRMEYTVIGDPVNLASRTESLNKPFGTDILITEDTWNLVGDKFITEEMPPVTVKGKEKPVRIFAVVNMKNVAGPQTLDGVRKLLGIAAPDLSKVRIDDKEKKYQIQS